MHALPAGCRGSQRRSNGALKTFPAGRFCPNRHLFQNETRMAQSTPFPDAQKDANELGTLPIGRLLFSYSIPAIIGMTVVSVNQVFSSIFVGYGVGPLGLAAMGIAFPIVSLLIAFCQIAGTGGPAVCSIELGKKNMVRAEQTLGQIVTLQLSLGALFGLCLYFMLEPLLLLFGASKDTLPLATDYMLTIVVTAPVFFLMIGLNNAARSSGYPKKAMITALFSAVTNCILAPLFIFSLGWGMVGAGAALAVSQAVSCLWLVLHFFSRTATLRFRKGTFWPRLALIRPIVSIGMSPFLLNAGSCIVVILINYALFSTGGDEAVGAYGIINRLQMLFSMACFGLGLGMQPIVGFNHGANRPDRIREALARTVLVASLITSSGCLAAELFPFALVGMFTDDPGLAAVAIRGLRISSMCFFLMGCQMIVSVYFQSIGRASLAIVLSLSRQIIFLVPCILLLPGWFGLDGVWYSIPVADFTAAVVTLTVFAFNRKELASKTQD